MSNVFAVSNRAGIPFNVRIVRQGDGYGRYDDGRFALTYTDADPSIEFYDARYQHTPFGQFVTRYFAGTLTSHHAPALMLDTGSADWFLDGPGLQRVIGAALTITTHPEG